MAVDFQALYAAFNSRDTDTLLGQMHPDVDWPNGWEGGRVHGREAVREYWTRQWDEVDSRVTPTATDRWNRRRAARYRFAAGLTTLSRDFIPSARWLARVHSSE